VLAAELRRVGQPAAAEELDAAERGGATSTEILHRIGLVLWEHRALRRGLGDTGVAAWDALMAEVHRAFPGSRLAWWVARLFSAIGGR